MVWYSHLLQNFPQFIVIHTVKGFGIVNKAERDLTEPKRSYPTSKARGGGQEELPHSGGQGQRPGGATPRPRSGGCDCAGGRRRAERSYSTFKVRRGSREEIPLVQGKEQRLRFAGAALKRYPRPR